MYYISAEIPSFFKEIEYKFDSDQGIRDVEVNAMEYRITVYT